VRWLQGCRIEASGILGAYIRIFLRVEPCFWLYGGDIGQCGLR
jgi:hypothetical protein